MSGVRAAAHRFVARATGTTARFAVKVLGYRIFALLHYGKSAMAELEIQGLQSSLFFESPEEIYTRVFRELKPRTVPPVIRVEFRTFANEIGRAHV